MNDFETLHDAFAELERRADVATLRDTSVPIRNRRRAPALLLAASVVAVLAVAGGVALVARNGGSSHPQAGGAPAQQSAPVHATTTAVQAPAFQVPKTADELAARFRAVLDGSATFTVTATGAPVQITLPGRVSATGGPDIPVYQSNQQGDVNGAAIVGTLTAQGVTGGYDLQIFQNKPSKASCDDPDRSACTVSTLPDGSSLAIGHESLPTVRGGVTYEADLIRADGVEFLMHVSNAKDPKGESALLAGQPPLTTAQMTSIVTSDKW